MKKRVIVILCAVLVIVAVFVLLKKDKPSQSTDASTSSSEVQQPSIDNSPVIENGTKNPDRLVEITMPLSYYDAVNKCDVSGFFNKDTYQSCRVDEKKKTFTVTLKSITHDFMLANVGIQVVGSIGTILDSDQYPYIKGLGKYNSDFSEIEFIVNEESYRSAKNTAEMLEFAGSCGILYQLYTTENSYKCKIILTDEKTGEKVTEKTFRQDNSSLKS